MPTQLIEELRGFHRFLADKLSGDNIDLSPEEVLDEWRRLHPQSHAFDEDVAAIREALDDIATGDQGIPFDEFDRDFRRRLCAFAAPDRARYAGGICQNHDRAILRKVTTSPD